MRAYDEAGNAVTTVLDFDGRKRSVTDPAGAKTSYEYYGAVKDGRLQKVIDPGFRATTYDYDANGNVVSVTDNLGRVTRTSYDDSRGNKTIAYEYSPGGRLTRMTLDDVGAIDYRYDATGRLATIWDSFDTVVFYQYEQLRLKQRLLANGSASERTWNADGTLAQLRNSFMDGMGVQSVLTQHDYAYDALGRRGQVTDKVGFFSAPAANEAFAYDPVHNRTQRTAAGVDQRFGFDAANELVEIRDGLASNALVGALVYDANGNLTKKCTGSGVSSTGTDCTASNVVSLAFDASNRLRQAAVPNGTETYGYDDQGRRIRKTVNGVNTFYLYNGEDIVAEYGDSWTRPTAITLHGAGTDDPIARYTRNGSGYDKAYYHADGLGSVVALTKDDGTITGAQMFDSWGAKIGTSSIGDVPAYGFTGREPDATGLVYYRARYYDPSIGRFVSQDPIGMKGGRNLYAYVNSDPINATDPSGLVDWRALGKAYVDILASGAGVATGGVLTVAGVGLLAAPEPMISKAAGAMTLSVGIANIANSGVGVLNAGRNFARALQDDPTNPGNLPTSGFGVIADTFFPGSQSAQDLATVGDLSLALASGRVPVGTAQINTFSALQQRTAVSINGIFDAKAVAVPSNLEGVLLQSADSATSVASRFLNATQVGQLISLLMDKAFPVAESSQSLSIFTLGSPTAPYCGTVPSAQTK